MLKYLGILALVVPQFAVACESPTIEDAFSIQLEKGWWLSFEGGKGCKNSGGGEFVFLVRPPGSKVASTLGWVIWGDAIRPAYGDFDIIDDRDGYRIYRLNEPDGPRLMWAKKGEKYLVKLYFNRELTEDDIRVLAAFNSIEVH